MPARPTAGQRGPRRCDPRSQRGQRPPLSRRQVGPRRDEHRLHARRHETGLIHESDSLVLRRLCRGAVGPPDLSVFWLAGPDAVRRRVGCPTRTAGVVIGSRPTRPTTDKERRGLSRDTSAQPARGYLNVPPTRLWRLGLLGHAQDVVARGFPTSPGWGWATWCSTFSTRSSSRVARTVSPHSQLMTCGRIVATVDGERVEDCLPGRRAIIVRVSRCQSAAGSVPAKLTGAVGQDGFQPRPCRRSARVPRRWVESWDRAAWTDAASSDWRWGDDGWIDIEAASAALHRAEAADGRCDWPAAWFGARVAQDIAVRRFAAGEDAPQVDPALHRELLRLTGSLSTPEADTARLIQRRFMPR